MLLNIFSPGKGKINKRLLSYNITTVDKMLSDNMVLDYLLSDYFYNLRHQIQMFSVMITYVITN
jgi:hypothetical protein